MLKKRPSNRKRSKVLFGSDLQNTLVPWRSLGSDTPTFTRATTASVSDFEGNINTALSGESRFKGARRVENICLQSEDISGPDWSSTGTQVGDTVTLPASTSTACRYYKLGYFPEPSIARFSVYIPAAEFWSDPAAHLEMNTAGLVPKIAIYPNAVNGGLGGWVTLKYPNASTLIDLRIRNWEAFDVTCTQRLKFQIEDVTGQSNQNPSEYVSSGVLSAPYHGANVDSVQYFNTLNANTVSSNVVTETTGALINSSTAQFGDLPGVSGDNFSTPDSVAASITGDTLHRFDVALTDYTTMPSNSELMSQLSGNYIYVLPTSIRAFYVLDVGGTIQINSTARLDSILSSGQRAIIEVARNSITGDVTFSVNGVQLGAVVSGTSGVLDASTTGSVLLGRQLAGRIYSAQVYDGIDGTLAVDFDAGDYESGSTWASSETGETWTINGNASIYQGYWDAKGPFGYMAEAAATNICLQNRDFTNAAWAAVNMTPLKDEVGIDGVANSASSLLSTAANGTILQTFTITSAVKDGSFWLKRLIGTGNVDITIDNGTTWTTKTLTTGWNKFDVTATLANPVIGIRIVTSGDKVAVDYAQLEASAFASSEIETTTVAVTRNADVLTYDDAGNIEDAAGTASLELSVDHSVDIGNPAILSRDNGFFMYSTDGITRTSVQDGTNIVGSGAGESRLNTPVQAAATWGNALTAYAGTESATGSYDGTLRAGDLVIGAKGTTEQSGYSIRNVKIYSNEKSAAEVASIS